MENYNYTCNTVLKFLRKVLNEINKSYIDSGMRTAFLMKRYIEKYDKDNKKGPEYVLLCMLKDIGLFYMDGEVPSDNPALAAASSYTFLEHCSPLGSSARPLLFYKAKYIESQVNPDYEIGLLMTLLNQVSLYIYQKYDVDAIEELLKDDRKNGLLKPDQVKKVIKLLHEDSDIIEKLNSENNLYIYETSKYISTENYSDEVLEEYIDTTSFAFEFHNHETLAHTVTTAQIAYDLAIKCRLTKETAELIKIAGKVHDIGKIRVPREILCYPGRLEGEMLDEMRMHVVYTREIIDGSFSYKIVEVASRHHEKADGSGYPNGLTDKELTSADKILAVADICSALYCKRSYKEAFNDEKIQEILLNDALDGKLDKRIVEHLLDSFTEIMNNAKQKEALVLQKYNNMKAEYEALSKSEALTHFFEYDLKEENEETLESEDTNEKEVVEANTEESVESETTENVEETIAEESVESKDNIDTESETLVEEESFEETIAEENIESEDNQEEVLETNSNITEINDESTTEETETSNEEVMELESEDDYEEESKESESLSEDEEFERYINSLGGKDDRFIAIVRAPEIEPEPEIEEEVEEVEESLEEVKEESPKVERKPFTGIQLGARMANFDPFAETDDFTEEEVLEENVELNNPQDTDIVLDNQEVKEEVEEDEDDYEEEFEEDEDDEDDEDYDDEDEDDDYDDEDDEDDDFEFYVPNVKSSQINISNDEESKASKRFFVHDNKMKVIVNNKKFRK